MNRYKTSKREKLKIRRYRAALRLVCKESNEHRELEKFINETIPREIGEIFKRAYSERISFKWVKRPPILFDGCNPLLESLKSDSFVGDQSLIAVPVSFKGKNKC